MSFIPPFPTLVTRTGKGAPLLDSELDANFTNLRQYCLTLANLLAASVNSDGTLVSNSVGSGALQAAAVTLASLNPSLLYSIIPVDTDTGAVDAYAITAQGGLGGTNIVPPGATYDSNGNYVLTGLTLNYGYYWTKGAADTSLIATVAQSLTATGAFSAQVTSVTLTGTPSATVTATVAQAAPISAYRNGQMFFVYTTNANAGASTLSVNNIGNIPLKLNGQDLPANTIGANSVFGAVYENGIFVFMGGAGGSVSSGDSGSSFLNYTFNGTTLFASGRVALTGAGSTYAVAHGFLTVPSEVQVVLFNESDATVGSIGQSYPFECFFNANYTGGTGVATTALTGAGSGATVTPTLANGSVASAVVVSGGTGYNVGDFFIPADATGSGAVLKVATVSGSAAATVTVQAAGGSASPAFTVSFDDTHITVKQGSATPTLGGLPIVAANWKLMVLGTKSTNISQIVFPALNYFLENPEGGFCYGNNMLTFNSNGTTVYGSIINLTNNRVTPLSAVGGRSCNIAILKPSTDVLGVFTSDTGVYKLATTNPVANVVPQYSLFDASGYLKVAVTPSTSYTFSSPDGEKYSLTDPSGSPSWVTTTPLTGPGGGFIWIQGVPLASVNAVVTASGSTWGVTSLLAGVKYYSNYKPVWVNSALSHVYAVGYANQTAYWNGTAYVSPANTTTAGQINDLQMVNLTSSNTTLATFAATIGTNLNLTNTGIANISEFNTWYPSGATAHVTLFQYNPISRRIYVMTSRMGMVHIFQISTAYTNGILDWWTDGSRYTNLSYVKSIALSGAVASNPTVEIDMSTGAEKSICYENGNSMVRVPWLEG